MVICLERGADLHMVQLCHCHSLSLALVKSTLVLPFWYRLTPVVPEKGPLNGCVCFKQYLPTDDKKTVSHSVTQQARLRPRHPLHDGLVWTRSSLYSDRFPYGPITIAIRARFEYDSSTIRSRFGYNTLQHATRFLCARIRDRFEHSTRISGRRVLHVD